MLGRRKAGPVAAVLSVVTRGKNILTITVPETKLSVIVLRQMGGEQIGGNCTQQY
jgi:hypothetical protein